MAEISLSQRSAPSCQFLSLPKDVIIEICFHLTPRQTIKLALSCRSLYELLTSAHTLWSEHCRRVWLHSGPCPPETSWYSEFVSWCREWGPYQDVYADVKRAWDLVYLKFEQSGVCPGNFSPGTNEATLKAVEKKLEVTLPTDYRCFLRMHDGQFSTGTPQSLFDTKLHFYNSSDDGSLLLPALRLQVLELEMVLFVPFCGEGQLQSYILCVRSGEQFESGSVQCVSKIVRSDHSNERKIFYLHTLASSFQEWFSRFASEMQRFPLIDGVLQRYPYNPDCVATTRGITIRVGTAFSNVYSRFIAQYLVIYHITISMSDAESPSLASKLTTRHWIITDYQGKQEEVHGEGVVGHTPEISPGTVFTYTSGSHVERGASLMEGYFTFRNLSTGEIFDVKVPKFRLEIPPYCTCECALTHGLPQLT